MQDLRIRYKEFPPPALKLITLYFMQKKLLYLISGDVYKKSTLL